MSDAPVRRIAVHELTSGSAWNSDDPLTLACPICGRLIGVGGMKGWLIRRLRDHFGVCRPKYDVFRRRAGAKVGTS